MKIIKTVEATHKNLGLPTVFAKLIDLANMGMFIVGPRGTGKGAVLHTTKELRHRDVLEVSKLTPAGLAKIADSLNNKSMTVINPDFSSFYTDYLKDAGINLIAHIITEHGVPQSWTAKYSYTITNCTISFLTSIQPRLLRKINSLPGWESMYKDRFIRFHMLYPFGTPTYRQEYPQTPTLTFTLLNPETDVALPKSLKQTDEYKRLATVLFRQTSEGRAQLWLDKLLKAHAYLNNRDCVAPKDLQFLTLFLPYLMLDYLLAEREEVSAPLRFNPNAYSVLFYLIEHEEATRKELQQYFMLQQQKGKFSALTRAIEPLRVRNIIEGEYGTSKYRINKKFYEKYFEPIVRWAEEWSVK